MKVTRRDALLALAGAVGSAAVVRELAAGDATVADEDLDTLEALADVLYPSSVAVTREFVETYVLGRAIVDEGYLDDLRAALQVVRTRSRRETGREFASLDGELRDRVLRSTGADRAYPDPDGTTAQRVRHYVVDELLYALYTTPKGGGLVGNDNPKGHPGGTRLYQRPPEADALSSDG